MAGLFCVPKAKSYPVKICLLWWKNQALWNICQFEPAF